MKFKKIKKHLNNNFNFIVNMDDYRAGNVLTDNNIPSNNISKLCEAFLHAYLINKTNNKYGYCYESKRTLFDLDDEDFYLSCGYSDYNRTTWSCEVIYTNAETEYSVDMSDITDEDIVSFLKDNNNNTLKDKILELLDKV